MGQNVHIDDETNRAEYWGLEELEFMDVETGRTRGGFGKPGERPPVGNSGWSWDRRYYFSQSGRDSGRIWDMHTGELIDTVFLPKQNSEVAPFIQRLAKLKPRMAMVGFEDVRCSPDGTRVIRADIAWPPKPVPLFDGTTGNQIGTLGGGAPAPLSLDFSRDGRFIHGTMGGAAMVWDARTGAELGRHVMPTAKSVRVRRSISGRRVVIGDAGGIEVRDNLLLREHGVLPTSQLPMADLPRDASWAGESRIITSNRGHGVIVWKQRRPAAFWGVAWLWEFWVAAGLLAVAGWRVMRDSRAANRSQ